GSHGRSGCEGLVARIDPALGLPRAADDLSTIKRAVESAVDDHHAGWFIGYDGRRREHHASTRSLFGRPEAVAWVRGIPQFEIRTPPKDILRVVTPVDPGRGGSRVASEVLVPRPRRGIAPFVHNVAIARAPVHVEVVAGLRRSGRWFQPVVG